VFAASFATSLSLRTFGEAGLWIAFFGMSLVIMLATEVVPKVLGLHWSERVAPVVSAPLALLHTILLPIRIPLGALSDTPPIGIEALWIREPTPVALHDPLRHDDDRPRRNTVAIDLEVA